MVWIIGAFVFVVSSYFLYRSFSLREGPQIRKERRSRDKDITAHILNDHR